jgi:hypothetical protein
MSGIPEEIGCRWPKRLRLPAANSSRGGGGLPVQSRAIVSSNRQNTPL